MKLTTHINLSDKNLFSTEYIVIKFGSETCPPCLALEENFDSIRDEIKDKVTIYTVDVDENTDIMIQAIEQWLIHSFMSIPTTFIFKDWERIWQWVVGNNLPEILKRCWM